MIKRWRFLVSLFVINNVWSLIFLWVVRYCLCWFKRRKRFDTRRNVWRMRKLIILFKLEVIGMEIWFLFLFFWLWLLYILIKLKLLLLGWRMYFLVLSLCNKFLFYCFFRTFSSVIILLMCGKCFCVVLVVIMVWRNKKNLFCFLLFLCWFLWMYYLNFGCLNIFVVSRRWFRWFWKISIGIRYFFCVIL